MNPDTKMWVRTSLGEVTFGSIIRLDYERHGERYFLFCDIDCIIPLNVVRNGWIFTPVKLNVSNDLDVFIYNFGGESVSGGDVVGVSSSVLGFIRDVLRDKERLNES